MKHKKLSAKILSFALAAMMILTILPTTVLAAKKSTPTRNTMLDVSKLTETTDMLDSEGWKWVPAADGGTLTLRNCYIKSNSAEVVRFPDGNVTIILEGENTLTRSTTSFNAMVGSDGVNAKGVLNLTIAAGTEDGKLNILRPDTSVTEYNPYGFSGKSLTIQSGEIYSNTDFCIIQNDFSMQGGSLTVDSANIEDGNGVYSAGGNISVSGGSIDISTGVVGLYIAGNVEIEQKISLTGGDVKIRSGLAAIYGKNITIDTDGALDLQGGTTALYCSKVGGTLEIISVGDVITLAGGRKPYLPEVTGDGKTVIIHGADYTEVNTLVAQANALNSDHFTTDLSDVKAAVNAVTQGKNVLEQATVDGYATAIENAIAALQYKDADYTKVDEALAKIPSDLSIYANAQALIDAKNAVVRGKNITEQATVDGYATAIENAIAALKYKDADYTKVDEAIAKIPSDLSIYANAQALIDAKNAVVRGKNITEQATVDGYATAIENALTVLKKKPVISITNPETGTKIEYEDGTLIDADIVLSVTSKPQTEMDKFKNAVDKTAPGLVLGGLYDVKLLKDGVAIQPDGKIKISIPLTDKMKSMTNLQIVYIDDNGNITIIPSEVKDGKIIFVTDHFSNYGVIGKVKATDPGTPGDIPQTGDNSSVLLFILMILASGTGLIILAKKRRVFIHFKK